MQVFRNCRAGSLVFWILTLVCLSLATLPSFGAGELPDGPAPVAPEYDSEGALLLPEGFERWILAGSSVGLSYGEGGGGSEMFHFTLIEPTAYNHFQRTGEFRQGTMLALLLHGIGEGALPSRRGSYASRTHAVELAVKDAKQHEGGWGYYNFTGRDGLLERAKAFPPATCQTCHTEHAAYDNVFLQFYPLLVDAAPVGALPAGLTGALTAGTVGGGHSDGGHEEGAHREAAEKESSKPLALGGHDPVLLVEGREEVGKPEIVVEHGALRYQFVSEPSRKLFAEDPERYSIQNDSCLVVPGAPLDPALFSVYEARIYAFATTHCRADFEQDPESYLEP